MSSEFNLKLIETSRSALHVIIVSAAVIGLVFGVKAFFSPAPSDVPVMSWDIVADYIGHTSRVVFPILVGFIALEYSFLAGRVTDTRNGLGHQLRGHRRETSRLDKFLEYLGNVDLGQSVKSKKT